ncbi:hypothetical protein GPK27_06605 [Catenibacterium mitsuokai]|jgi:CheY-like chemotaxis protein|uniref:DpnD/PcfM family protein n=1 Tax=Coprobacillaceae TaxID=2810280 RepID=UPI00192CC421|nr:MULTISPECIES: DpnD/PcfM family protein [Coprobacillaceae]MBT9815116.1 hypothetical protein [Catenibacterium mitsuokai]MCR1948711.1 DpnD/PcfM family protein [Thomasclavelia ramosa]QQY26166.1 DpnD/PcfM family protein [Thomasclavelia ramosa]
MKKYRIEITETLQYQEVIEAENEQEAIRKIKEKYQNQDIILDESNHVSTEFDVLEKVKKREQRER